MWVDERRREARLVWLRLGCKGWTNGPSPPWKSGQCAEKEPRFQAEPTALSTWELRPSKHLSEGDGRQRREQREGKTARKGVQEQHGRVRCELSVFWGQHRRWRERKNGDRKDQRLPHHVSEGRAQTVNQHGVMRLFLTDALKKYVLTTRLLGPEP